MATVVCVLAVDRDFGGVNPTDRDFGGANPTAEICLFRSLGSA